MRRFLLSLILVSLLVCMMPQAYAQELYPFSGSGTESDPFLISSPSDLCTLSELVNNGASFTGQFFLQTQSLDMQGISFIPIGLYGESSYFCGTYDGNGHYLSNLNITYGGNNSLFGMLGGTVMNLGIESGQITGACVGSFASHSSSSSALIINCYNKATVNGARAGGIADNFNGTILNCWTDCDLNASESGRIGAIYSYSTLFQKNCYTSRILETSNAIPNENCEYIPADANNADQLVSALNNHIVDSAIAARLKSHDLNLWTIDEFGNITLSPKNYSLRIRDNPSYIQANMIYIVPGTLSLISLVLLFCDFSKRQKPSKAA